MPSRGRKMEEDTIRLHSCAVLFAAGARAYRIISSFHRGCRTGHWQGPLCSGS
jgi:hypothetical protein